jgi:hypothetical protein
MNSTQQEIEILRHEITLGRDSVTLRARLDALLLDNASTLREEMAILARFEELTKPVVRQFEQDEGAFRCVRCCRLLEPEWKSKLCRGCREDENSEIRDDMYRNL